MIFALFYVKIKVDKKKGVSMENASALIEQISQKHSLGDFNLKTETVFPADPKRVKQKRHNFNDGIRSVSLKYLRNVDSESFFMLFGEKQRNMIEMGFSPTGWTVHHQKSLFWGGHNFNPALKGAVYQTKLTKPQLKKIKQGPRCFKEAFLLDNFLKEAQKKNCLKKTFLELFQGYLILLPADAHQSLEKNFLQPQIDPVQQERDKGSFSHLKTYEIAYPAWKQIILWGQTFERTTQPKTVSKGKNKFFQHFVRNRSRSKS